MLQLKKGKWRDVICQVPEDITEEVPVVRAAALAAPADTAARVAPMVITAGPVPDPQWAAAGPPGAGPIPAAEAAVDACSR